MGIWLTPGYEVLEKRKIFCSFSFIVCSLAFTLSKAQTYSHSIVAGGFEDEQTGSLWSITGKCIAGELKGKQLKKVHHGNHFAFAWFAFRPDSEIYGRE